MSTDAAMLRAKPVVVALGGNALAPPDVRTSIGTQFRHARESVAPLVDLAREGWPLAVVHGNGPQVGDALVRNEVARDLVEPLPLGVLVAATAGWIGYMIQQSLQNGLAQAGIDRPVLTVVTQTLIDPDDPRLAAPTKPIGLALTDDQAAMLAAEGASVGRDADGRFRRLAASPVPVGVVESGDVASLVRQGIIVIAAGGGGPPVVRTGSELDGRDAVVDKDRVAALLARDLGAEALVILTNVDAVYRGWGTPAAEAVRHMDLAAAEALIAAGELDEGGMRPKVEAAIDFVRSGGGRAIIAHLEAGVAALRGETGTTIEGNLS
jgi:carbamate kinase